MGDISEEAWNERYDWMNGQGKGGYYLLVIEDQGRIVGTGALLVERKLYVQNSTLLLGRSEANMLEIAFTTSDS